MTQISVTDLARVIYSSGKVFDRLTTGRLATEAFLRSGNTSEIRSRADLDLLQDLRDAGQFILLDQERPLDAQYVCEVNRQLTRSAAIDPGQLRKQESNIGVATRFGRHTPDALTIDELNSLVETSRESRNPRERALELFVQLAKAQPFDDGNKRTALFTANRELITSGAGQLLTIPVDESDDSIADAFNNLLARAYMFDEHEPIKQMLRNQGFMANSQANPPTCPATDPVQNMMPSSEKDAGPCL